MCDECGLEPLRICWGCNKAASGFLDSLCKECTRECGEPDPCHNCFVSQRRDDPSVEPAILCAPCAEARHQASVEVIGYWYWQADNTKPLSPTNVYRIPRFREVPKDAVNDLERAQEALAAYQEEMKFSGSEEEALKIYVSFYNRGSRKPKKTVKVGIVSKAEILAGQPVTPAQFFASIKVEDEFHDEEPPCNDPKLMSLRQLYEEIQGVYQDRDALFRRKKGKKWSPFDDEHLEALDDWEQQLQDELTSRR